MKPAQPLHPAVVRGYFLWVGLFIPLWALSATAAAYATTQLEGGLEPAWAYIMVGQLLTLTLCAVLAADIVARCRTKRCAVLYLRKFRGEPMEAFALNPLIPPARVAFRMPMLLDFVGLTGVRLFALRDARTPGSRHVIFYWMPVYLLAMMAAPAMLLLYASWAGYLAIAHGLRFSEDATTLGIPGVTLALVLAVAAVRPLQKWLRGSMERHSERVRALFQPGARPRTVEALESIRARSRSVGAIAVKSSDQMWLHFVEHLLRTSDAILFDIRASSENCEAELALIRRLDLQDRVTWAVRHADDIARTANGYVICGVAFAGAPRLFVAPEHVAAGWRGYEVERVRLLSQLLHAFDACRAPARDFSGR